MMQISALYRSLILLSLFLSVQGCSTFNALHPANYLPNSEHVSLLEPSLDTARLIIIRPRETLLSFPESHPVQLYQGDEKISDIQHGQFIVLDSPHLPQQLTIHWFDQEYPHISQLIQLTVNLKPGETQTVKLVKQSDKILAQTIDSEAAAVALPWLAETKIDFDQHATVAGGI